VTNAEARRYERQVKLVEVGQGGQARIAAAERVVVGGGLPALVEARYLAGAGFGRLVVTEDSVARAARETNPAIAVEVDPTRAEERGGALSSREGSVEASLEALSPACRDVALGAYRALAALRGVVLLP
jgi:hypothetical protein